MVVFVSVTYMDQIDQLENYSLITISITVTFMFHSFFRFQSRSWYLTLSPLSFSFALWSAGTAKSTIRHVLFFLFPFFFFFFLSTITWSIRLTEIKWSICILKSRWTLCVSFSKTDSGMGIYHMFVWSNSNFLHNFRWIAFLTQSYLVLFYWRTHLLHSIIMWLIASSL